MELMRLLRILRRWLWLIVSLVLVTGVALAFRLLATEDRYRARVMLQFTPPLQEEVWLFGDYRPLNARDALTVSQNNFDEVLQSRVVRLRTIHALGLDGKDRGYTLASERLRDADFIEVSVTAGSPEFAAEIADAHVSHAIAYFGELRAKPALAVERFLGAQRRLAEKEFLDANEAFIEFQRRERVASLQRELDLQHAVLAVLLMERDREPFERSTPVAPQDIDALIAERRAELERLMAFEPAYNLLEEKLRQARIKFDLVTEKYESAALTARSLSTASSIQVVDKAQPENRPVSNSKPLFIMGLAGSLGLGIFLALLLEYITTAQRSA